MRRLILCVFAALSLAPAHAQTTINGSIKFPNPSATYETPATPVSGGITRNLSPCNPDGEYQGYDGYWIFVEPYRGMHAVLTPSPLPVAGVPVADFDGWFYDDACRITSSNDFAQGGPSIGPGFQEEGDIPVDADWMQVTLWLGTPDSGFTFTISAAS